MAFVQLVMVLTIASMVVAQNYHQIPSTAQNYDQIPSKILQVPEYISESSNTPPQISLSLEIPKQDAPAPFDSYAPSDELRAPNNYEVPTGNFYEVPVPSQDLEVPAADQWNPSNDPTLFYELPIEITKEVIPTNLHPKKYNKQVFEKVKPFSSQPKEEVLLVPVKIKDLIQKQKQQDKTILNFVKAENQKQVQAEKVKELKEPIAAASGFHTGFNNVGAAYHSQPISSTGKRVEFQMHGYDGPKSYKWGYDTGKGHNRQFRYEERDKDGYVKGHYGYFDKHGKLQMVHYDADPHEGFHAEGNFGRI